MGHLQPSSCGCPTVSCWCARGCAHERHGALVSGMVDAWGSYLWREASLPFWVAPAPMCVHTSKYISKYYSRSARILLGLQVGSFPGESSVRQGLLTIVHDAMLPVLPIALYATQKPVPKPKFALVYTHCKHPAGFLQCCRQVSASLLA